MKLYVKHELNTILENKKVVNLSGLKPVSIGTENFLWLVPGTHRFQTFFLAGSTGPVPKTYRYPKHFFLL